MIRSKISLIAADPRLVGRLCDLLGTMPNIDFPTMGGPLFWDTLAESQGWRLQKNVFTNHCRLLDPSNVRRAWGSESAMMRALQRLSPTAYKGHPARFDHTSLFCPQCGGNIPEGNYCSQCGSPIK